MIQEINEELNFRVNGRSIAIVFKRLGLKKNEDFFLSRGGGGRIRYNLKVNIVLPKLSQLQQMQKNSLAIQ